MRGEDASHSQTALHWRFAGCQLDEARGELRVNDQVVEIQRVPLDVLRTLLRHAGEVVTKDELAEAVWTRTVVDDAVITKAVGKLRAALGDRDQAIIKTVHGVGYRLMADVAVEDAKRHTPQLRLDLKAGDHPPLREHWVLTLCLGAGGYGEVWLAEHQHTHEQRVFKFAADGTALTALKREVTLFRLLRESLGERDDIQPLLDWNLTEQPYFVEQRWEPGGSLLQWAEAQGGLHAVPLTTRLDLLAQVAGAVSAAHGIGVLHKDLKPANIIIDTSGDAPRARLSDFGSGRVIDSAELAQLGITRMGFTQTMALDADSTSGTPMYLAPEVLAGQPLSVKADNYALGVMLFQLVVGDFSRPIAPGWVRDVDDALLRGDIADCVDGDPARRLGDAGELVERLRTLDQRHHLAAQQQRAQADAARLEQRLKQARQRRTVWAAVASVSVLGLGVSLWFHGQAQQARTAAETAAAQAQAESALVEQMNTFLVDDLIGGADFNRNGTPELTVAEAIANGRQRVDERFADQPLLAARLRSALASTEYALANYEAATALNEQALAVLQGQPEASPRTLVDALLLQSSLQDHASDYADAIATLQWGLDRPALLTAPGVKADAPVLFRLHQAQRQLKLGQHTQALANIEQAETLLASLPAHLKDQSGWELYAAKGGLQIGQGQTAAAADSFQRAIAAGHAVFGTADPRVVSVELDLAAALTKLGEFEDAIAQVDAAQPGLNNGFDPNSFMPLKAALWKGRAQLGAGLAQDAVDTLEPAATLSQRNFGPASLITLVLENALADGWIALNDADAAEALLIPARDRLEHTTLGPDIFATHTTRFAIDASLCRVQALREDWPGLRAKAVPLLEAALAHQPPGHATIVDIALSLAQAELALGDPAAARRALAHATTILHANAKPFGMLLERARALEKALTPS